MTLVVGYAVGVRGYVTLGITMMFVSVIGGLGWIISGRVASGCAVMVFRGAVGVALFVTDWGAYTNGSACHRMLYGGDACYRDAVRDYHVVLGVFALMPFLSAAVLAWRLIRGMERQPPLFSGPRLRFRLAGSAVRATLFLVVLVVPAGLAGYVFDRSDLGQPKIAVKNDTDAWIYVWYRKVHPADAVAPHSQSTLQPLTNRFISPDNVSIAYEHTYWDCAWPEAKAQEPLVITEDSGPNCRSHTDR